MDEFHLLGPTALASNIGQASMETRVDHGKPGGLGAWLLNPRNLAVVWR